MDIFLCGFCGYGRDGDFDEKMDGFNGAAGAWRGSWRMQHNREERSGRIWMPPPRHLGVMGRR